jgi:hypothetical protein
MSARERLGFWIFWVLSLALAFGWPGTGAAEDKKQPPASTSGSIIINGYLQADVIREGGAGLRRAVLIATWNTGNWFDCKFEFDAYNEMLRDAFVRIGVFRWMGIKAGKWFACFTATPGPQDWYLAEHPKTTNLGTIFGVGVVSEWEASPFICYLGVLNGTGEEYDDNSDKDVYANVSFRPAGGFSTGIAYQRGKQPFGMRDKLGIHFRYSRGDFYFVSEYMRQSTSEWEKWGCYATCAWRVSGCFGIVCQAEAIRTPEEKESSLTLGTNLFMGDDIKVQLNGVASDLDSRFLARIQFRF